MKKASRRLPADKYPFASVALYGPDTGRATKMVAALFRDRKSRQADAIEKWAVDDGDVRVDRVVTAHFEAWLKQHGVKDTVRPERILRCPHEEGIDYPMGRTCPQCPFWADVDRFTHERIAPPEATMSADEVMRELSRHHQKPPVEALASADALRATLAPRLIDALARGIELGEDASDEEAQLLTHALYLLAKWRETRAYPLVLRWLALPVETTDMLTGDVLTQDGARILAAVFDGDVAPIRALVLNRDADAFSRDVAIGALALLAAWGEVPRQTIVSELLSLAAEELEREPSVVWGALAVRCADIEALEVFPELRRACDEGLIDPMEIDPSEWEAVEAGPPGRALAETRDREPPIVDVAEATAWWGDYYLASERVISDGSEPYLAPPKVGRNDPCPCGSGKKYKKCCGA